METIIFSIALIADVGILTLSIISLVNDKFQFWPPPNTKTWQYYGVLGPLPRNVSRRDRALCA